MGAGRQSLETVVAEAWRIFDLPVPKTTGVCRNCCMDPVIEADFLNHAARDLPADYVRDWFFAAFGPDLDRNVMAWLLPRIMQLLAEGGEIASAGDEVALARLPVAGFPGGWNGQERACIARFCHALLATRIEEGSCRLDETLCLIANSGLPVEPFLADVQALDDAGLVGLLHRNWIEDWCGRIIQTAFWVSSEPRIRVWEWYLSDALELRLTGIALKGDDRAVRLTDAIRQAAQGS